MGFFGKRKIIDSETINEKMGKVITFLNQKGGVGKTTLAFNTAHALAKKGARVLCIDMDPQANLSLLFEVDCDLNEQKNIHHLLLNSIRELKVLHTSNNFADVVVRGEVDLLPAGQELSGFELSVAGISAPRQLILKKFIEKNHLLNMYDYIVIDCPPTLGLLVVNVLCAAQGIMVPFRPDDFSRKGLSHFYEVLEDIEDMGITEGPQVLAHIPNLVEIRRKQESDDLERITNELKEEFGHDNIVSPMPNRIHLMKSQSARKSVYEFHTKDFKQLQNQFDELANIITDWNR
ncbi:MAG: ParA family protein [Halobacteriovoraceae bacterium]|nr:ParA family protein [Halobacteriovoraceae bacterium]